MQAKVVPESCSEVCARHGILESSDNEILTCREKFDRFMFTQSDSSSCEVNTFIRSKLVDYPEEFHDDPEYVCENGPGCSLRKLPNGKFLGIPCAPATSAISEFADYNVCMCGVTEHFYSNSGYKLTSCYISSLVRNFNKYYDVFFVELFHFSLMKL